MELIKILKDNELSDIKFKTDEISIYISKNSNSNFVETKTQMVSEEILTKEISNNTDDAKLNLSGPGVVKSPMVGTKFLLEPGANPFVNEGDEVTKGQTLFIVEYESDEPYNCANWWKNKENFCKKFSTS